MPLLLIINFVQRDAGAVSHFDGGQLWHTKWIIQGLCASPALSPANQKEENEKFVAHKPPKTKIVCHSSSIYREK